MGNLHDDPMLEAIPVVDGYKYLGPCVLHDRIGAGGMGTVYRGRHTNLDIDVAVKCLNPSLALRDHKFVTRFHREAKLAASLDQENLIRVYDVGTQNDLHYIVMEYVRGETARARVWRKGPLSESEAMAILLGAASALAAAHGRSIVHRDIKPDNIMISVDGRVKVADLGLAKPLDGDSSLTQGIMGTTKYMAPEQWVDPDLVGPWTDVWALGATFFFLVTGHDPFPGASAGQPFPQVQNSRPDLSSAALDLLDRCVCRDRERRFAHAGLLLQRLRALRGHDVERELADRNAASTSVSETLVSPPPRPPSTQTLVRVATDPVRSQAPTAAHEQAAPTPPRPAVTAPTAGSGASRARRWLALVAVLGVVAAGTTWWLVDGARRVADKVAACRNALAQGDLDEAVRLCEPLPASESTALRAELGARLSTRAEQRRGAGNLAAALADLRHAKLLAPGPAVETACAKLEQGVRALLLEGTTLSLAKGSVVGRRSILEVSGPPGLVRCTVQGVTTDLSSGAGKAAIVCTADGPFELPVELEHEAQVTAVVPLSLVGDVSAPGLTVVEPSAGAVLRSPVTLRGTCSDANATVWVDARKVAVVGDRWTLPLELAEGSHAVAVWAEDAVGNRSAAVQWRFVVDNTPPALELAELPPAVDRDLVDVAGTVESGATVTVAGESAPVEAGGRFRSRVPLPIVGRNELVVQAKDHAGNPATRTITIERLPPPAAITVLEPAPERAEWSPVVVLKGRVRAGVRSLTIGGVEVPFDSAGAFVYAGQFAPGPLEFVAIGADASRQQTTLDLRPLRDLPLVVDPPAVSADRETSIRGRTEPDALVRIGDRVVAAGADGRFEVAVVLPGPGVHELTVNAWRAGAPGQIGVELPRAIDAPARVVSVQPDTAAACADIRPGDMIEAIGGRATDAQGVLTVVAGRSGEVLELRVRRGGERSEIVLTPWPSPAATVRTRVEVAAPPSADDIVPVFGIEPGVTTRDEVERLGTAMDSERRTFKVQGHEVHCDEQVAERVVLADKALPANWVRLGLSWGSGQQECMATIGRNRWTLIRATAAVEGREGALEFDVRPGLRVTLIFPQGKLTRAEIKRRR